MFERKKTPRLNAVLIQEILKETSVAFEKPKSALTADDVLSYLMEENDIYRIVQYPKVDSTIMNRVNMLWFMPLFVLTMPVQYLIKGHTGFSRDSRLGKLITKLLNI